MGSEQYATGCRDSRPILESAAGFSRVCSYDPQGSYAVQSFHAKQQEEIQYLADMMQRFDLISGNDITGLVEDRFARNVDLSDITDLESILP